MSTLSTRAYTLLILAASIFLLLYTTSSLLSPRPLTYRAHLESTTSPLSQLIHSQTLTFSNIYVLSLPGRIDRRREMGKVAEALGLRIRWVDARRKEEGFVKWIAERVLEVRREKVRLMAETRGVREGDIGGLQVGTDWLARTVDREGLVQFPLRVDERWGGLSWIEYLEAHDEAGTLHLLLPEDGGMNVSEVLWDPKERIAGRQVNEGVISTWWGHTRAMKMSIKNGDESALVLEDDVDVEWDLERMWSRIERKLPRDWDMTFLGHCWGRELLRPAYHHPLLHASSQPLCLHAYALSSHGSNRLLSLLQDPWSAFQTAIDTAVPSLLVPPTSLLNSYSIDPPLVVQRKDGPSDIQSGSGSRWRGLLGDSTVERIKMDEGEPLNIETEKEVGQDPATVFRYFSGRKCKNIE